MRDSWFGKVVSVSLVAALFYIGHGLNQVSADRGLSVVPAVQAGVGVAQDQSRMLFTSSADGRTIYAWSYEQRNVPKFQGQSHAIAQDGQIGR